MTQLSNDRMFAGVARSAVNVHVHVSPAIARVFDAP